MNTRFLTRLLIGALSVATAVAVHYPLAAAQRDSAAIARNASEVTIFLDAQYSGSGVVIDKQGNTYRVLTAGHVVPKEDEYYVVTSDKQAYQLDYSKIEKLPELDLAILEFTSPNDYPVAEICDCSHQMNVGHLVYVAGFPHPLPPRKTIDFAFVKGIISIQFEKPLEGGYKWAYDNVTSSGMSGGPVLDREGNLVAIHGQAEGRRIAIGDKQTGILKTGFNFGIPIESYLLPAPASTPRPTSPPPPRVEPPRTETPRPSPLPRVEPPRTEPPRPTPLPRVEPPRTEPPRPTPPPRTETPRTETPRPTPERPKPNFFVRSPRLVDSVTTQDGTAVPGATYYFTISLPKNAGAPLEEVKFEQTRGTEFLGYNIEQTRAFRGTKKNKDKQLFVQLVDENSQNRTLSLRLDPPLREGETVTIALNPVLTPRSRGVYQLRVEAFPPGENARGRPLGVARLHFYNRR